MRILPLLGVLLLGSLACAGGGAAPDRCSIEVVGTEEYRHRSDGLDVAYRVKGVAGSAGTVWLAARNPSGTYVPGYGVDVGPGAYEAIVDLKVTGEPEEFVAVLEVLGKRCKDDAPMPAR